MTILSENPTYLASVFGLLALIFLVLLRMTQQGKYLVGMGVSIALGVMLVAIERVWVTDNERIEETVYALGKAVKTGDADGALDRLTPDVQLVAGGSSIPGGPTRQMIKTAVNESKIDVLRISHLRTNAGGQSRRGTAEFQVFSGGQFHNGFPFMNATGAASSGWSLGLREMSPGVWKVSRITPVYMPGGHSLQATTYVRPGSLPATVPEPPAPADPDPAFGRRGQRPGGGGGGRGRRSAAAELDVPHQARPLIAP